MRAQRIRKAFSHFDADVTPRCRNLTKKLSRASSLNLRTSSVVLRRDEAAVRAAATSKWSNGQTEGQINRLKFLKRQMFGRAKFDLLKARVLYHPAG